MVILTHQKIDPEKLLRFVRSKRCGGVALFLGEVRNHSGNSLHQMQEAKHSRPLGQKVLRLEYSAYPKMALKKMGWIRKQTLQKWKSTGIGKVAMAHRLGKLNVGEIAVAVAVSAVHRREAIHACLYGIDQIKKSVPIFKKEFFRSGKSRWAGCERSE